MQKKATSVRTSVAFLSTDVRTDVHKKATSVRTDVHIQAKSRTANNNCCTNCCTNPFSDEICSSIILRIHNIDTLGIEALVMIIQYVETSIVIL